MGISLKAETFLIEMNHAGAFPPLKAGHGLAILPMSLIGRPHACGPLAGKSLIKTNIPYVPPRGAAPPTRGRRISTGRSFGSLRPQAQPLQ